MIDWVASKLEVGQARNKDKVVVVCEKCGLVRSIIFLIAKRNYEHLCRSCVKKKNPYTSDDVVLYKCVDCGMEKLGKYDKRYYKSDWRCHHCAMVHGHKLGKFKITKNVASKEGRKRIAEIAKANWLNPEYRKKWKESRDKTKEIRSNKSKEIWSDKDRLQRLSDSLKLAWQRTE